MEDKDSVSMTMASPQAEVGEEAIGKLENGVNPVTPAGSWDTSATGLTKVEDQAPSVVSPTTESTGGVALKVATTMLQPICLGESPVMLPIHLQMAGAAGAQLGQMGAAPYFMTSQGPVSLPLVLDQQVLQHLNAPIIPQTTNCPALPLPNNVLCQNASLALGLPSAVDQKSTGQAQDANLLSLLQNPAFAAILQDLFPSPANSSSCQSPSSVPTDPFTSTFFPPPLAHPYASPLVPLVPPPTLLVPYPVVIPLPVPLPIPLPIPIPVPQTEDSKGNTPKPVCTVSRSTQTYTKDTTSPPCSLSRFVPPSHPQHMSPSSLPPVEGEVLDLSIKTYPVVPKQEFPSPQDNVLDLSMAGGRRVCVQSCGSVGSPGGEKECACRSSRESSGTALSLGVLRPVECTQRLDSKLLSSLASLEFSRQHKWMVDSSSGGSGSLGREAGNLEIVSASQTAKVIVSVKDAIPAILCGKIKGLSGVSTKNFSIKRDGSQGATLQQLYGAPSRPQGEQHDPNDPLKKVPKNRAIKLKKVSSQEIHILPIKKQRLAAFLPRK